ncbi:DNA glycosylase [Armillaria novae-zelandiae]|uniref:DNA glycosylase n=1 Tax=Armillaria novae-zelandiae TaxID=153914 RepID=A0AA39PKI3_9AGAR|nr:DNA glycosylase [Armillaria novae-zelandiae]
MPAATRSSTRSLARSAPLETVHTATKRKASTSTKDKAKKAKTVQEAVEQQISPVVPPSSGAAPVLIPAQLSFSFEDAKQHLISADPRFEDVFGKLKCTPFEVLEQVHPFRAQQISWKAARSINHKFKRDNSATSFFPSPEQVAATDPSLLRSAGLSGRKGEYVQDLASRFADGRLSTEKLMNATDEDLFELLIAVKGVGKVFDMFAIFSLRRPNILPVGDLGVQRGVLRWFLSLHSPTYNYTLSDKKNESTPSKPKKKKKTQSEEEEEIDKTTSVADIERPLTPDVSSAPPGGLPSTPKTDTGAPALPPAFTPSINRTLHKVENTSFVPEPLPEGLTVGALKSRLDGKKKIKGALLTPAEMEGLSASWKPYRSLGTPSSHLSFRCS